MEEPDASSALTRLLDENPLGVALDHFAIAWNLSDDARNDLFDAVPMRVACPDTAPIGFAPAHWDDLATRILAALKASHESSPEKPGLSTDAVRRALGIRLPVAVLDGILTALVTEEKAIFRGNSYCLPGFSAELAPKDAALWKKIEPILEDGHTKPPVVHEIAKTIAQQPVAVERFLIRCARLGMVNQVAKNRFLLPEAVTELGEIVEGLARSTDDAGFGVAAFRDRSGIGRNLAIEILEYFDKAGLTWRSGDTRKLRKPVAEVFGG